MIVRTDKLRDCFSMTGVLKPIQRVFVTDDADVAMLTGYSTGSEAVNISTKEKWMLRPDGFWHKVGTDEAVFPANIYGVSWTIGASNKLARTDAAANFADPVPSVNGSAGSSPFDELMPWAGMQIVEDEYAGTMVSIPKFYYRITKADGVLNVQISDGPADGFAISPAHMDRGDGKGERDVVYIARYHCANKTAMSTTNSLPMGNTTRANLRLGIMQLSAQHGVSGYSIQDYAMFWTTRLLMLVEYATWDMQSAIGYGCGNGESLEVSGKTDSMPYHTGTVGETRDTYCVGVQYRYIEDMWANVGEFIDGWHIRESTTEGVLADIYVTLNPAEFSDTEGGVKVGELTEANQYGLIMDWNIPETEGYSWAMTPAAAGIPEDEDFTKYVADFCVFEGPALVSGGNADEPGPFCGPFVLGGDDASGSGAFVGARLQKLP